MEHQSNACHVKLETKVRLIPYFDFDALRSKRCLLVAQSGVQLTCCLNSALACAENK